MRRKEAVSGLLSMPENAKKVINTLRSRFGRLNEVIKQMIYLRCQKITFP